MLLHVHEWGDAEAPPLVCLHGVTAHGERFKQLAEERWARHFHVVAPDLRGPFSQDNHAVGELRGLLNIVRDQNHRARALVEDARHLLPHAKPLQIVER